MGKFLDEPSTGGKFLDAPPAAEIPRGEGDKIMGAPTTPESIMGGMIPGTQSDPDMVQRIGNTVLPPLMTAPTTMAGGAIAGAVAPGMKAAPFLGRALTSGALSGAEAGSRGENPLTAAAMGTLTGAASEGVLKALPRIPFVTRPIGTAADRVASRAAGEASVTPRLQRAFDLVRPRIPTTAVLDIPAINPTRRITLAEAERAMSDPGLLGANYRMAFEQLTRAMDASDKMLVKVGSRHLTPPWSGQLFRGAGEAPAKRFHVAPSGAEQMASSIIRGKHGLDSPTLRSVAESAVNTDVGARGSFMGAEVPLPLGAVGAAEVMENTPGLRGLKNMIPR